MEQEQEQLPWEVITSCLTLNDTLSLRLTNPTICHIVSQATSPTTCAHWLALLLANQSSFICTDLEHWKTSTTATADRLRPVFVVEHDENSNDSSFPLDRLLKVSRILKCLPQQAAVAYNGKYGRHILPMDGTIPQVKVFSKCQRLNCPTCKFKIPLLREERNVRTEDTSSSRIFPLQLEDCCEILNKDGVPLDLHSYVPKCIPNLPPDVTCPMCRVTERRTLILSSGSYQSESSARTPTQHLATFTPKLDVEAADGALERSDTEEDRPSSDEEDIDDPPAQEARTASRRIGRQGSIAQRDSKRRRTDTLLTDTVSFPPRYNDPGIPMRQRPIPYDADGKHLLSIHCSHCEKFAILTPVTPCWNGQFPCHFVGSQLPDKYGTIVGGMLVRSQCSASDCTQATLCRACQSTHLHLPYGSSANDDTISEQEKVTLSSHCPTCQQSYCTDHAWHSTVCHHW